MDGRHDLAACCARQARETCRRKPPPRTCLCLHATHRRVIFEQAMAASRIQKAVRRWRYLTALSRTVGLGALRCPSATLLLFTKELAARVARLVRSLWPTRSLVPVQRVPTIGPECELEVARLHNRQARAVHTLVHWYRRMKVSSRLLALALHEFVIIGAARERDAGAIGLQARSLREIGVLC